MGWASRVAGGGVKWQHLCIDMLSSVINISASRQANETMGGEGAVMNELLA